MHNNAIIIRGRMITDTPV